jgi:hypothetical protein
MSSANEHLSLFSRVNAYIGLARDPGNQMPRIAPSRAKSMVGGAGIGGGVSAPSEKEAGTGFCIASIVKAPSQH